MPTRSNLTATLDRWERQKKKGAAAAPLFDRFPSISGTRPEHQAIRPN